jgi:hypothetical protein
MVMIRKMDLRTLVKLTEVEISPGIVLATQWQALTSKS